MKSSPLLNGRTANPSEASKRPIALNIMGSSSTTQTTSGKGFSLGVMRICAIAPFSMWDVAIISYISPDSSAGYWFGVMSGRGFDGGVGFGFVPLQRKKMGSVSEKMRKSLV